MYLLKLITSRILACLHSNLHSTMYLLKPSLQLVKYIESRFTFHYVSIKTIRFTPDNYIIIIFTFHYVSIKTKRFCKDENIEDNLHSTMYLLKPLAVTGNIFSSSFTFHYVSIKTSSSNISL